MNSKEKIKYILNELDLKAPTFAKNIGVVYQRIYDLQSEKTKKISGDVANAICSKYPQFTISWLLTGEGEMLKNNSDTSEIPAINENEIIKELQSTVISQQSTINKLTEMLYNQNKKADVNTGVEVADVV